MRKLSVLIITLMTVLGTHIASAQDAFAKASKRVSTTATSTAEGPFVFYTKFTGNGSDRFNTLDKVYIHYWMWGGWDGTAIDSDKGKYFGTKQTDGWYKFEIGTAQNYPRTSGNYLFKPGGYDDWSGKTADLSATLENGSKYTVDVAANTVTLWNEPVVDPNRFVVRLCGDNTNLFPAGFDENGSSADNVMTTTDGITYTYTRKVVSGHHPNNYGMGLRIHDNTVEGSSVWMQTTTDGELTNNAAGVKMVVEGNGAKNVAYNPTFADDTDVTFTYTRTNTATDVADLTGTLKVSYKTLGSTPVVFDPNHRGYEGFDFNNAKIEIVTSSSAVRSYAVSDADAKTSVSFADIKSATLKDVVVPAEFEGVQLDWNLDVVEDNGSLHFKLAGNQLRKAYFAFKDVSGFGVPAAVKVTTKTGQELTAVPCNKPAPKSAPRRAAEADADGNYWYTVVTNATAPHATEGSDVKVAVTFEEATVTYVANDNAKANGFQDQTSTLPAAIDNSGVVAEVAQSAAHTWPTIYVMGSIGMGKYEGQLAYHSEDGIYYFDNFKHIAPGNWNYWYKFSFAPVGADGNWNAFNANVLGVSSIKTTLAENSAQSLYRGNNNIGNIELPCTGTLEINLQNNTITMHNGFYRPASYNYVIAKASQSEGEFRVQMDEARLNVNELDQIEPSQFYTAAPVQRKALLNNLKFNCFVNVNGLGGQGSCAVTSTSTFPVKNWKVNHFTGADNVTVKINTRYTDATGKEVGINTNFEPTISVAVVNAGSKSTFDAAARLAEAPVQLTDWVDAPAGFPGNTAAHPVKINKANQYTFTFKPALAVANATDVTYDYTVNGVAVTPVDNADGSKTVGMLPFDAGSRSNAPVKLGITAKYTLGGVQYTGATEYHDIPRAAFDAKPANFVQGTPKVIKSGGFIHNSQWNVYSLCVPFSRNTDVNNSAYYICGMKVNLAPDFYTSTPQTGFQDFSYGVVGAQGEAKEFDRTPFVAAAGMDNIPGVTGYSYYDGTNWSAANNWAELVTKSNDFAVMLPHFFAQGANGNAEIKHGNATVEFHAYYPVVYNPALLGTAPASPAAVAALAAGDKTVVESVKQTLKASANELAGASYAGDQIVTGVENVAVDAAEGTVVNVYNLSGVMLMRNTTREAALRTLPAGLYIIGRDKVVVE